MPAPQPGDLGLVITHGLGSTLIRLGDRIEAWRKHLPHEPFNHVIVAVSPRQAVQAEPSGANYVNIDAYPQTTWFGWPGITGAQRQAVSLAARRLVGTGYSWLDIAALTLDCLGWDVQRDDGKLTLIGRRIARNDRLVCSALADLAYQIAGLHLYDDGRMPGEVTPGDVARSPRLVRL